jgi:hypothetical protein
VAASEYVPAGEETDPAEAAVVVAELSSELVELESLLRREFRDCESVCSRFWALKSRDSAER